jgi:hypothetical protein
MSRDGRGTELTAISLDAYPAYRARTKMLGLFVL